MSLLESIRALGTTLSRSELASVMFGGKRDLYRALGYKRSLSVQDYRARFERNEVAARVVEALPFETWGGGGTIIEDEDLDVYTTFERAWDDLDKQLHVWSTCQVADVLSGIGRHGVILFGAPGLLESELTTCSPKEMAYLAPYGEDDCKVSVLDMDPQSARYGLPTFYTLSRVFQSVAGATTSGVAKQVHHSRIHHIADNRLDDRVYGHPRMERVWNRLDDLEKLAGGGSESFWKRADMGRQFNLDATMDLPAEELAKMKSDITDYINDMKRDLTTRGLEIKDLGSSVAQFSGNIDAIVGLICAGTGIPQRILVGSERGALSSTQDKSNWEGRVLSRRQRFAEPYILRPVIDKFIALGVLPAPEEDYRVQWENAQVQSDEERADLAAKYASINASNAQTGGQVITVNEIRSKALGLPPLEEVVEPEEEIEEVALEAAMLAGDHEAVERLTGLSLYKAVPPKKIKRVLRDDKGRISGVEEEA